MDRGTLEICLYISLNPVEYEAKIKSIVEFFSKLKETRPDMAVHIEAQIAN